MSVPVTFLSAGSRSALGNAITNLAANETYLVIPWSEVRAAINSPSATPDGLEDWIAAILYQLLDKVVTDTNSSGQKVTAGRRFIVTFNGKAIDPGIFEANTNLASYTLSTTLYIPDPTPDRPLASQL